MRDQLTIMSHFARERWLSPARRHEHRHEQRLRHFLDHEVARAPRYRDLQGKALQDFPIVDKATVLADFAAFNAHGITLDNAIAVARQAELSRDFSPTIDGLTVGLSSGTTGRPGVFLVSPAEQRRWAGVLLATSISPTVFARMRRGSAQVSLLLRANSNLYQSIGSRRLRFRYHDLALPLEHHLESVARADVIVGPASVLVALSELIDSVSACQVISAAETLEPQDAALIERRWGVVVDQIYQATEGFLGFSCRAGRLHLNESMVHIEREWLDQDRFVPVVTDFTRTTQFIVRYRLDDVLLAAHDPCPCGRPSTSIRAVLGRADDILYSPSAADPDRTVPVFPDVLRHAMAMAGPRDYRLRQIDDVWHVAVSGTSHEAVQREIDRLAQRIDVRAPQLQPMSWPQEDPLAKRRRISRVTLRGEA